MYQGKWVINLFFNKLFQVKVVWFSYIPLTCTAVDLLVVYKNNEGEINNSIPPTWEYQIITFNQEVLKEKFILAC